MKWTFFLGIVSLSSLANGQAVVQDEHLYTKPASNILVKFTQSLDGIYSRINRRTFPNRDVKSEAVVTALRDSTSRWHKPALDGIKTFGVQGESFWITNEIYVKDASPLVVAYLSGVAGVESIREEQIYPYEHKATVTPLAPATPPWGVPRIGAPDVWKLQNGNNGTGIRVGVIDTGARGTHEALKSNYVGAQEYGWFDPAEGWPFPVDFDGYAKKHGSHCTATAVGSQGVGVAPGAKWMHCKTKSAQGLTERALILCGEFMFCPHDGTRNNWNCTRAPHIVSNSWGGGQNSTWYNDIINAWNSVGIIPVFALGNSGPNCDTHNSPGDQPNLISVGNSATDESIWWQSSRGPSGGPNGDVSIPMISAPGTDIQSAYYTSDTAYAAYTGTSQACPHVAGAIALLKSKNPSLTRKQVEDLLTQNTFRQMKATGYPQCGNTPEGQYPNSVQGWGRLDILASYQALLKQS